MEERRIALAIMATEASDDKDVQEISEVYNRYAISEGPIAAAILAVSSYRSPEKAKKVAAFFSGLAEKCHDLER